MILDKRWVWTLAVLLMAGCGRSSQTTPQAQSSAKPIIVATTSTLASLVKTVAGDRMDVHSLVPIGASPETYEPSPSDLVALSNAAVVVENGSGLELWLSKLLENAKNARIVVLADALPAQIGHPAGAQFANPHFWLDPHYAAIYVGAIASALSAVDPPNASFYRSNALVEQRKLAALDVWTVKQIATIPVDQRAMIADHDAWYYFDRRYGIEDVGAIERFPGTEPSASDLAALIAQAKAHHVRAIFAEPEFSPRLARQLADSAGITTVTDLYDDSLGTTPELSTYEGMMHHDVNAIVQALR
ncbi:MAG TPA: metal ABC transporter substrate-binding protein [Candidatus Acidoferrales bacterium]|nr:metal ABC transporter substrate-binding protein [Candidatus Acidoferrales bacterium]